MTDVSHTHDEKNPISNQTGEYLQEVAEKETDRTKKSGVQVNIDETNAANAKVEGDTAPPASFDKTEAGQREHERKYGKRDDVNQDAVSTRDTKPLNPTKTNTNPLSKQKS